MKPWYFIGHLWWVLPAIGGGLAQWLDPKRRARRALERAAAKSLGAVVEGDQVRVLGVAQRGRGSLTAHFSGRKCIAFRCVVEERREGGEPREIFQVEHALPFVLAADGVEANVEGPFLLGLQIDYRVEGDPSREVLDTLAKYGVSLTNSVGQRRRLEFYEGVLEDGDPIWVFGRAHVSVDPRGRSEELRGPPIFRVFEGTKREPVVLSEDESIGELDGVTR